MRLDAVAVCVNLLDLPGHPEVREQCIRSILALRTDAQRYGHAADDRAARHADHARVGRLRVDGDTAKIVTLVRQARELGRRPHQGRSDRRHRGLPPRHRGRRRHSRARARRRAGRRPHAARAHRAPSSRRARAASSTGATSSSTPIPPASPRPSWPSSTTTRPSIRPSRSSAVPHERPSTVNVGIIGGGLMGREIAAALRRWPALIDHPVDPRLVAVCDINPAAMEWFDGIDTVRMKTTDYTELLADPDIDVVYVAVRHDLHEQLYIDTIRAGKACWPRSRSASTARRPTPSWPPSARHPAPSSAVSSEMPFFPGAQWAIDYVRSGALGRIVEAILLVPALQRPRREQAAQLEAPEAVLRRGRRHERPRHAHLARAAAPRLGTRAAVRRAAGHRHRAARSRRRARCPATPGTTRSSTAGRPTTARRSRSPPRPSASPRAEEHLGVRGRSACRAACASARRTPRSSRCSRSSTCPASDASRSWQQHRRGQPVGVADGHRRQLRVGLLGRDPADVGGVPRRS